MPVNLSVKEMSVWWALDVYSVTCFLCLVKNFVLIFGF